MIYLRIAEDSAGHGLYDTWLGDRHLGRWRSPLLSAARLLLDEGMDFSEKIALGRGVDGEMASLGGILGECAKVSVEESARRGPAFIPYRPFAGFDP